MQEWDDEGLNRRKPIVKQKPEKGNFTSEGIDWTYSSDGHVKLMGHQRSNFPLSRYGSIESVAKSFGSEVGLTTVTLRELRDGIFITSLRKW